MVFSDSHRNDALADGDEACILSVFESFSPSSEIAGLETSMFVGAGAEVG